LKRCPGSAAGQTQPHTAPFNSETALDDRLSPYRPEDLNKIAFWKTTGSGKALLMHSNILPHQYDDLTLHGTAEPHRICRWVQVSTG